MKVIKADDLWFCEDCYFVSETGDESSIDYYHGESASTVSARIWKGVEKLQTIHEGRLHADNDSSTNDGIEEYSNRTCDCCEDCLTGSRYRMLILGDE